jgi:hypothetical protein
VRSAALIVIGLSLAPQGPPSPEAGTLKFAWPSQAEALVETEYIRQGGVDPAPQYSSVRITYRMRVLPHPDGRQIRYEDQRYVDSAGDFAPAASALLPFWIPVTVVGSDGAFIRIEESQRVQELFAATLAPLERLAPQYPALREYLAGIASSNGLESRQSAEWRDLLSRWIGLSPTQPRREWNASVAVIAGVMVPTRVTLDVIERVQCMRDGEPQACATYELRSSMDRDALKQIFDRMQAGAAELSQFSMTGVDYEGITRVTLETATMLPHAFVQTRTMHGTASVNGRTVTTSDFESLSSRFTYQQQP